MESCGVLGDGEFTMLYFLYFAGALPLSWSHCSNVHSIFTFQYQSHIFHAAHSSFTFRLPKAF